MHMHSLTSDLVHWAEQEHICIERTLHGRMVEVVEGAYAEVCSANDELELADWCRRAQVPLPQLVCVLYFCANRL